MKLALVLLVAVATPALAQDAGTDALAVDPQGAARDLAAGMDRRRSGDLAEALELLRSAQGKQPDDPVIAHELGYVLARLGARREAEGAYRQALALAPERFEVHADIADLVAQSPDRWQRRDEILASLDRAQASVVDGRARQRLALAAARFERSVGRLREARRRAEALVTGELRKPALDLLTALEQDERAAGLADWPEPTLDPLERAAVEAAHRLVDAGDAKGALARVEPLISRRPTATPPRFVRARALEALGRYDQATRELELLLQIKPSQAEAWRALGTILAQHGGGLEAERADQALRRALALEPSWEDLRALRTRVAAMRSDVRARPEPPRRVSPTARAQALYDEAQRLIGTDGASRAVQALNEALKESPSFVEAAASLYALGGTVPSATKQTLWGDADELTRLATLLLRVRRDDGDSSALVKPMLDRAAQLGSAEALFTRALLRAEQDDAAGALADLTAYVGSEVAPPRLSEARALRSTLEPHTSSARSTVALARQQLLDGRPQEAQRTLGGPCRPGVTREALIELARIEQFEARPAAALGCLRLALEGTPDAAVVHDALTRVALLGARWPAADLPALRPLLERGRAQKIPAATWALARLARQEERWSEATSLAESFLALAPSGEPLRAEALRTVEALRGQIQARRNVRLTQLGTAASALLALLLLALGLVVWRRTRGRTIATALARMPDLFPDVARTVAELRHDVLKHRASGLGLLGADAGEETRAEVGRTLHEPVPVSEVVIASYERLARGAAAAGVTLRPWEREPVFGPLVQTLRRAEEIVTHPRRGAEVLELDRRLREEHGPALASLLRLGPRTRLDPAQVTTWIRGLPPEDERAAHAAPAVLLPTDDLDLPLTSEALFTVLSNLVRNALAATGADGRVLVRVEQERDITGRRLVLFLVADSASASLSLDDIERRDGQRGLGIVRELVRRWGGHLVVRPEPAPYTKAIGAAFPITGEPAA